MVYHECYKPIAKLTLIKERKSAGVLERFYKSSDGRCYLMQHFTDCAYKWYVRKVKGDGHADENQIV